MASEVLIVGAGVTGLLTAKRLLDSGVGDIVVLEKGYPGSGGSFRCATGIRASFTSREHIEVMKRAIELWPKLSAELGIRYSRDGYLWLLRREKDLEVFKRVVAFQNSLGVPTKILDPDEVEGLVPTINAAGLLAAVHDPMAGKASCFDSVVNTLSYLKRRGVKILCGVEARAVRPAAGAVEVETSAGPIRASKVIVAAASETARIVASLGARLPIEDVPKHALVTEAFKPTIRPLIIDWATSSYIVQVFNGNIYIGADVPEPKGARAQSRLAFLEKAARVWTEYFEWLKEVYVLRYWTGYYDMTPDHHPIIGPLEEDDRVIVAAGFSGHGFMMAPAVAEALAKYVLGEKQAVPEFESLRPSRFARGRLIKEVAVFG